MHMSNGYASPVPGPLVVKYGGSALVSPVTPSASFHPERSRGTTEIDAVLESIATLWSQGQRIVLVHGGGPEIDRALDERGITTTRIEGLRVTDEATLHVTEAVLCGSINKRLVRQCSAAGIRAVGLSGEDGALLVGRRAQNHALGYVGDIAACDPAILHLLLSAGYMPVVAPLAVTEDGSHALNVNADLAAAAIAGALNARAFLMVTNVQRVLRDVNDPNSAIDHLTLDEARTFAASASCSGGMKPKIDAAVAAVHAGADASYICGVTPLALALAGNATIVRANGNSHAANK